MRFVLRDLDGPDAATPHLFASPEVFLTPAPSGRGVRISAARPSAPSIRLVNEGGRCLVEQGEGAPTPLLHGKPVDGGYLPSGMDLQLGPDGPQVRVALLDWGAPGEATGAATEGITARLRRRQSGTGLILKTHFEGLLAGQRRRATLAIGVLSVTVILLLGAVIAVAVQAGRERESTRLRMQERERRMDARLQQVLAEAGDLRSRLEREQDRIQEIVAQKDEEMARLTTELEALRGATPAAGELAAHTTRIQQLEAALSDLGGVVERIEKAESRFKSIVREKNGAIFLMYSAVDVLNHKGEHRGRLQGFGSGFVVDSEGWLVTSKHVVQPWKFDRDLQEQMAIFDFHVDPASLVIAAWRAGSHALDPEGDPDLSQAFVTAPGGGLEFVTHAPDTYVDGKVFNIVGDEVRYRYHAPTDGDLALLRLDLSQPAPVYLPLRAADAPRPEKLDPVMVLGFPHGRDILERGIAETSPSLGVVRKVEDTLYITASIFTGNSGGPVIATDGTVIGVATRIVTGTETLGICVDASYALDLLTQAREGRAPPPTD